MTSYICQAKIQVHEELILKACNLKKKKKKTREIFVTLNEQCASIKEQYVLFVALLATFRMYIPSLPCVHKCSLAYCSVGQIKTRIQLGSN